MTKINLLPEEFAPKARLGALAKILKNLTLFLALGFVIFTVGAAAFFLFASFNLKNLIAANAALRTEIKSREGTETKLVLLKDRLAKIKIVFSQASLAKSLADVEPLLTGASEATVSEISLEPDKIDASLTFRAIASLGDFFKNLRASSTFASIILNSFGFNPTTGYLVSLRFLEK